MHPLLRHHYYLARGVSGSRRGLLTRGQVSSTFGIRLGHYQWMVFLVRAGLVGLLDHVDPQDPELHRFR